MPILFQINSVVNSGSTGRIVEDISNIAVANGWDSYIAYGRWEYNSQSKLIKVGSIVDIYAHGLISRLFDKHGLGSKKSTLKLLKIIQDIKPDIIHLHNIHGYYINYALLFDYLSKINIPVVWTLHDCWPITGHCSYFDYLKCDKWVKYCNLCPQIFSYPKSLFCDRSERNYYDKKKYFTSVDKMVLVPVSDWLLNIIDHSFLNMYPKKRIYNGIDLSQFYIKDVREFVFESYKINTEYLILGVANIWDLRKGFNDFIKLRELLPSNFMIVLVGISKQQKRNLPKGIIGIQRTDTISKLTDLYCAADIYLNLTYEDNFPTTNLEALACGTPVITYRTGGSVESVTTDVGMIVDQGDFSNLVDSINTIIHNGKEKYASFCRQKALMEYSKKDRFYEYFELYNEILM